MPEVFDVIVIGSGPVGSGFARRIIEQNGPCKLLLVEAGEDLKGSGGTNIRNLQPQDRVAAYAQAESFPLARLPDGLPDNRLKARPGTFLARHDALPEPDDVAMPAAAMSSNVGGMAAHWTCACPRPGGAERIDFLPAQQQDAAFTVAEQYLSVRQDGFPPSPQADFIVERLRRDFGAGRTPNRLPQPMPLACRPGVDGPIWAGVDVVLGPLADPATRAEKGVELRTGTLCRSVLHSNGRVTGVSLRDLASGREYNVSSGIVMIAADAFRTPQLLYASNIRPDALGRYLNDQPQVISLIELDPDRQWQTQQDAETNDQRDSVTGVSWIPYADDDFPFHAQLMQMDTSPIPLEPKSDGSGRPVVGLGLFAAKQPRAEDRIIFDGGEDALGMPRFRLDYCLSEADRSLQAKAHDVVERVGASLGRVVGKPIILPAGTSLHYQGSYRMGSVDDGTSTCDPNSRVWGFDNLYLGGNGIIPTPTACNPTLTAVALAVMAADHAVAMMRKQQ
ncbi:GMC oxidoreductase [Allorhizobium terrae]|uniref:Pyranose oxidase n=1 Tax=Allorhizobium terrae TaxID=1848972 RepID=A0A4S3ZXZ8_9HYPH|nr:GMC oxidoreductase [Allorhizobium terrae]THF50801.1 pyranose oxidase precursor [Allorhizobium terrae]